jgi:Galactosyltransferase
VHIREHHSTFMRKFIKNLVIAFWISLLSVFLQDLALLKEERFIEVSHKQSHVRKNVFLLGIFGTLKDTKKMDFSKSTMLEGPFPYNVKQRICGLSQFLRNKKPGRCQILYTFVVGGNDSASTTVDMTKENVVIPLDMEYAFDLTILNIRENMNDGKTPSWFYYASLIVGSDIDYVAKIDLDTFISIPILLNMVNDELPMRNTLSSPSIYGGVMMDYFACGGIKLNKQCRPIKKKLFMSGQFYFISYDIVQDTSLWKQTIVRRFEDLDFGIRVWKYRRSLKAFTFNKYNFWIHYVKDEHEWRKTYHQTMHDSWNINVTYATNIK